jgi:hypothetical protein
VHFHSLAVNLNAETLLLLPLFTRSRLDFVPRFPFLQSAPFCRFIKKWNISCSLCNIICFLHQGGPNCVLFK